MRNVCRTFRSKTISLTCICGAGVLPRTRPNSCADQSSETAQWFLTLCVAPGSQWGGARLRGGGGPLRRKPPSPAKHSPPTRPSPSLGTRLLFPKMARGKLDFCLGLPALILDLCLKFITDLINLSQRSLPSCQSRGLSSSSECEAKQSKADSKQGLRRAEGDRQLLQEETSRGGGPRGVGTTDSEAR